MLRGARRFPSVWHLLGDTGPGRGHSAGTAAVTPGDTGQAEPRASLLLLPQRGASVTSDAAAPIGSALKRLLMHF